ncbi:hypothetical protein BerOc1_02442 [Pseudodesulfovibrio hydrargyri]|uniref:Replication initiator protein A n=1 Tax=Pseudodesulfovibrio hydrargyri TaxID=2125990 RepID=A0A1J5N6T3_9BACT|nr:hypothetical protein [Pseudodesulfovibrio hydrargyri]OIQ50504.1 hypothetical protein BerOc1_02442 [Pseudodesulfovibrio hydrargyri]
MFQQPDLMDNPDLPLQYAPYTQDDDIITGRRPLRPPFRIQHLGVFFLSDLFSAEYMHDSEFVHRRRLATLCGNKELFFTGNRFDQWDLDVLLYCVRRSPAGNGGPERCQVKPAELLHAHNRRNNEKNRERVFTSLKRLSSAAICIEGKGYQYTTQLMNRVLVDARQEECLVEVNGDVTMAFRRNGLEQIMRERLPQGGNGLAKWLLGAAQVYKGGFSSDLRSLYDLCRPKTKQKSQFIKRLEKALEQLEENGILTWWEMDGHTVRAVPRSTPTRNMACGLLHRYR